MEANTFSAAVGEQVGKPLANVCRDRDTADGGKAGQMTSNPADVDAIVKRAWQKIHKGTGGCISNAVDDFLDTYCEDIFKRKQFEVEEITGEMVQASFSRTAESAGALDGWSPKELSLLSLTIYCHIATLLNQIEKGAPWPRSSTHVRVVFLGKFGARVGQVMSYRPLALTSPLYRCWGAMRLECMSHGYGNGPYRRCTPESRRWVRSMPDMKYSPH